MKKFLYLLICSLWLYSCSDDSNPTGNDFSDMKFESVSIDVHGLRYNYEDANGVLQNGVNNCKYTTDTTKSLIQLKDGEYVYYYLWSDHTRETKSEEIRFKFKKNKNVIDSLFISLDDDIGYTYKTDPYTSLSYSSENRESLCLINIPFTVETDDRIIIDIPTSTFNKHVANYNYKSTHYETHGTCYNYTLNEYLGGAEDAYIKIVLTPAK